MQKFLIGLIVLVALLLAGLLVGPGLVDWNNHKARIAAQIEAAVGRPVTIAGEVAFALLPSPRLSAKDLRVAATPGASGPYLAQIAELTMRVAAAPLLQGRIQVEDLTLRDPDILLEILSDGRASWELPAGDRAGEAGSSTLEAETKLDRVRLINGRVRYRDAARDWTAERIDADLSAGSLWGPYTLDGSTDVAGINAWVTLALGRLDGARRASLKATVTLREPEASLAFSGSFAKGAAEIGASPSLKGQLEVTAADLSQVWQAAALRAAPESAAPPAGWAAPLSVEGRLDWSSDSLTVPDIDLKLGETSATGSLTATLGAPARWELALRAKRIDLDQLNLEAEAAGNAPFPTGAESPLIRAAVALAEGERRIVLQLAVETLVHRSQLVRQIQAAGAFEAGGFELTEARALLPGGSDLSLTGAARLTGEAPAFAGQLRGAADNLRGLLLWLGLDLSAVPPARLRTMSLATALAVTADQITLTDMDLRVDSTKLAGGLAVARRERLALGIGLTADRLNLDGYLPAATGREGARSDGDRTVGQAGPLAFLEDFDANFDVKLGALTAGGRLYEDLSLGGTLRGGDLTFEQARVGNVEGLAAGFQGVIRQPARDLSLEGRYDLAAADGARLLRLVTGNGNGAAALGPVGLSGSLSGNPTALSTDSTLLLSGGEARAIGILEPLAGQLDLQIETRHDSLEGLLAGFGLSAPTAQNGGEDALDLSGRLAGSVAGLTLSGLAGRIGAAHLSGEAAVDLAAARPRFTLALTMDKLELDRWTGLLARLGSQAKASRARAAGGLISGDDASGGEESANTVAARDRPAGGTPRGLDNRWSRQRQDFSWMGAFDLGALIDTETLTWGGLRLEQAKLEAELVDRVLHLARLEGRLGAAQGAAESGRLSVTGSLTGGADLTSELILFGNDLDLTALTKALAGRDEPRGRVSLQATLRSRGASEADWIANLQGEGDLHGQARLALAAPEAPTLTLPGQAAGGRTDGGEAGLAAIAPLAAGADLVQEAFTKQPLALSGSFVIRDGVLASENLRLDGKGARAVTRGRVDLPVWRLGTRSDLYRDGDREAYLTVELDGPIDRPNVRLKGQPFRQ